MIAEPPSISYLPALYGPPSFEASQSSFSSSEFHKSSHDNDYHYTSHPVGHQTSYGLNVDPHLLNKIKHVLIAHENSGSNVISPRYSPSSFYGVPSAWKTSDIHFDNAWQSTPVAYYLGQRKSHDVPQWHY